MDLTLNFVDVEDLEESMNNLAECYEIKDLYLTGNPCSNWPKLKEYVIAKIKSLRRFNGDDINKSERIAAIQILPELEEELRVLAKESLDKKRKE